MNFKYIHSDKFKTTRVGITLCDNVGEGRAYQNALITGILLRGSVKYPTMKAISRGLDKLFGANVYTSVTHKGEIQMIQFVADLVDEKYAGGVEGIESGVYDMLLDIITDPVTEEYPEGRGFKQEYFLQEKTNHNNSILAAINDKQSYSFDKCRMEAFKGQPYGLSFEGKIEDGENTDPVSLYKYYKEYFLGKMKVYADFCGAGSPDRFCKALEDSVLGKNEDSRIDLCTEYRPGDEKQEPVKVTEAMEVAQGKLNIGFKPKKPIPEELFFPTLLCASVFGMGTQSKLFQNVREKNSLAYYCAASYDSVTGFILAYSGISLDKEKEATELIIAQMKDIQQGNISDEELDQSKKFLKNMYLSGKDRAGSMAAFYLSQQILGRKEDQDEYVKAIENVKAEDVVRAGAYYYPDTVFFLKGEEEENE